MLELLYVPDKRRCPLFRCKQRKKGKYDERDTDEYNDEEKQPSNDIIQKIHIRLIGA